jgi:cation diffusion facilitator family transporter
LLLIGGKKAQREATKEHPFGFGRERYFYAFVVGLMLFTVGGMFAVYEGVEKIHSPHAMESPFVAVAILVVAIGLEGFSFRTAILESVGLKGKLSWWQFIRKSKSPELPVVLLEDSAALLGLVFALVGVGLSEITGNPLFDGMATLAIGMLLLVVAVILIVEMKSLLIGEGAGSAKLKTIITQLESGSIDRVIHIRTEYLGPEELLVAAKVAMPSAHTLEDVAKAIDDAELRVRSKVPEARLIYLEPDIDRGSTQL